MPITATTLRGALTAVPGATSGNQVMPWSALAAGADEALSMLGVTTTDEAAAFLANMTLESAYFRTTTEYGSGQRYAPYIGRTFEQVTWSQNYAAFGVWCHDKGLITDPAQFVDNPASLSDLRWAWLGGVWFWQAKGLLPHAKAGEFRTVVLRINGGFNGYTERLALYRAFQGLGSDILPAPAAPAKAARAQIAEDGQVGNGTQAAFMRLLGASRYEYAVAYLQRQLNAAGWTGRTGYSLAPDGQGIYQNIAHDSAASDTCYALLCSLGFPNNAGTFSHPTSPGAQAWQRALNQGQIMGGRK